MLIFTCRIASEMDCTKHANSQTLYNFIKTKFVKLLDCLKMFDGTNSDGAADNSSETLISRY